MSAILPKYKCELIAREVSRLLRLSPALPWQAVRDYAAPRLPGMTYDFRLGYDQRQREAVARRLDIELRHHACWTP